MTAGGNEWTCFKIDLKDDGVVVDPTLNISGRRL